MKTSPLIALLAAAALTPMARAETFVLTVTNHGPQPLSPVFFSASLPEWDIFDIGSKASPGIKDLAEAGDPSTMSRLAALSRGSALHLRHVGRHTPADARDSLRDV